MNTEEVVQDILGDFPDDSGSPLVSEEYAARALERSVARLGVDLGQTFVVDDGVVEMSAAAEDLAVLGAKISICQHLRAKASNRGSFSSGDKSMNRSAEAKNWADLEATLRQDYQDRLKRLVPSAADEVLVPGLKPVRYEAGRHAHHHRGCA